MSKMNRNRSGNPAVRAQANAPKAAAQPQDRKPKETRKDGEPFVVEVQGLSLTIDAEAMNDVELFDMIDRLDEDSPEMLRLIPRMVRGLFGDTQFDVVMNHLRDKETRRVTFDSTSEFISEVFEQINPN